MALADPAFQQVCLKMLADMTLSFSTAHSAAHSLFFLKGGNAATIHLHGGPPYPFKSDFDMTALIDPAEYSDELFVATVEAALFATFYAIGAAMPNFGPRLASPDFAVAGLYGPVRHMLSKIIDNPTWQILNGQSPFIVTLIPDLAYGSVSTGLTLIKVQTKTEPRVDIIDIAIPRRDYKFYEMEWEMADGNLIFYGMGELRRANGKEIQYGFYMANDVFTYFDQRIAAALNTRPAKRSVRTERANALEKMIKARAAEEEARFKGMTKNAFNPNNFKYSRALMKIDQILKRRTTGGYRPTKRNLTYLRKWRRGESIGFTMRSSLKAKGLIPRSNDTYKVSRKYRR